MPGECAFGFCLGPDGTHARVAAAYTPVTHLSENHVLVVADSFTGDDTLALWNLSARYAVVYHRDGESFRSIRSGGGRFMAVSLPTEDQIQSRLPARSRAWEVTERGLKSVANVSSVSNVWGDHALVRTSGPSLSVLDLSTAHQIPLTETASDDGVRLDGTMAYVQRAGTRQVEWWNLTDSAHGFLPYSFEPRAFSISGGVMLALPDEDGCPGWNLLRLDSDGIGREIASCGSLPCPDGLSRSASSLNAGWLAEGCRHLPTCAFVQLAIGTAWQYNLGPGEARREPVACNTDGRWILASDPGDNFGASGTEIVVASASELQPLVAE